MFSKSSSIKNVVQHANDKGKLTCICMQNEMKYATWFKSVEDFYYQTMDGRSVGRTDLHSDYSADLRVMKFWNLQRRRRVC